MIVALKIKISSIKNKIKKDKNKRGLKAQLKTLTPSKSQISLENLFNNLQK